MDLREVLQIDCQQCHDFAATSICLRQENDARIGVNNGTEDPVLSMEKKCLRCGKTYRLFGAEQPAISADITDVANSAMAQDLKHVCGEPITTVWGNPKIETDNSDPRQSSFSVRLAMPSNFKHNRLKP